MHDVDVQITAAGARSTLGHVLTEDFERPHAHRGEGAHIADEREDGIRPLQRVRRRDRLPLLAQVTVQSADDLALAKQDDEPLLDITRQPREVIHLEQLVARQSVGWTHTKSLRFVRS
jgi:hypothetical protein